MLKKEAENVVSYYKRERSLLKILESQDILWKYLVEEEPHLNLLL